MNGNDATVCSSNLIQQSPESVFKVAVLGAESTGKTTLCRDLAAHFKSLWVPEYMREFLQDKWDGKKLTCIWDDLLPIAKGQVTLENQLTSQALRTAKNKGQSQTYLFCDTSLFELMVYANWYYDDCPPALMHAAVDHHYDLILLTNTDIPWVADDLRDSPYMRQEIRAYFKKHLNQHNKKYKQIGGDRQERVEQVVDWITK
ncbi:AAA family ATPase [Psychrobacter sp. DM4]|uniref:AAA family ATPase n=1 Tax=Psychrobacter sp. DM4 TaxID=3440637 RepID=UPI003F4F6968